MNEAAAVARRLSVGYGSKVILSGVDAFLKPGGSTALVGSNGSGKSTLLKTLAGLLPVIDGGLEVLGRGPDGTIEAVGIESTGWARGVQWHPEDTAHEDAIQQNLYDALIAQAIVSSSTALR